MGAKDRSLIVSDGGLPSLLAAAIAGEEDSMRPQSAGVQQPDTSLVWPVSTALGLDPVCAHAASRHAEIFSLEYVPPGDERAGGLLGATLGMRGEVETLVLLRACYLAAARRCTRVVWPVHHRAGADGSPDLDRIARSIDRALLVGRLISLDSDELGGTEVTIETPFVDLEDDQIADMALDMELPVDACWWSGTFGQAPGAATERNRWLALLGGPTISPEREREAEAAL